jgi:hypothetical protein
MYDEKQMILFSTFVICFQLKKYLKIWKKLNMITSLLKGKNVGETDSEFLKRLNDLKNNQITMIYYNYGIKNSRIFKKKMG